MATTTGLATGGPGGDEEKTQRHATRSDTAADWRGSVLGHCLPVDGVLVLLPLR